MQNLQTIEKSNWLQSCHIIMAVKLSHKLSCHIIMADKIALSNKFFLVE